MASLAPVMSRPPSLRMSAQLLKHSQLQQQKQQLRRIASSTLAASPVLRSTRTTTTAFRRSASAAKPQALLPRQFARLYASEAPGADEAAPKARRLPAVFRWMWRLTYLSVLGTLVYIGYEIYQDRNPEPQVPRDPSKKTLVILG